MRTEWTLTHQISALSTLAFLSAQMRGGKPVGYLRFVSDEIGPFYDDIQSIISTIPSIKKSMQLPASIPFPLLKYWPDADVVEKKYITAKKSNRRIIEVSRLSLDKPARAIHVAKAMSFFAAAAATVEGIDEVYLTCVPAHARAYLPLGFRQCEGTGQHFCEGPDVVFVCQHWNKEDLADPARTTVLEMAEALRATGRICLNENDPENYSVPRRIVEHMAKAA